ncbi:MAG: InlB B-repeat-containing protein, partial [Clostridia bacterium]|nr:InlB B-repeat-containing protein [Clostridia bacterium]
DNDYTNVTSNLDVRATYDRLSYEVKFYDMNGNQIGDTQTVYYGEDAVAPVAPEVEGYTFTQWDKDFTNVTSNLDVNALYNIIKCTVTFNLGDYGTTNDQYTWVVDYNTASATIIAPTVEPTSDEYSFTGWDDTLPEFITEDITINALYEVPTFEVKFFDMDGNQIGDTQVINYGQSAVAPAAPEVEGYAFTGWDTIYTNVTSNLAVNAKYERLSYEVKFFDMNGNQIGETQTVYYGEDAVAPAAPEVVGYTFDKWDTAYINVTSDLEVNALYNRLSYEVKFFDMDGNQIGETQTVYYGEDAVAPTAPEVEGYTFIEWDAVYTNVTADLTVNATYERLSYEVKFFDKDGNQIGETQTVYYGEDAVAPATPEVEGYTFDKWDVVYTDVTADLEVNALYNIKQYTVTFVVGENGTTDDQLVWVVDYNTASSEITVPVVETVGEAYTFSGWDKELPDFITKDITLNAIINLDGEITVSFAAGENGVIFHVDNGETVVGNYSITVQAGQVASEAFTLPYVLANDGYMFDGWYVGDALFDDTAVLDSSITLTAKFVERVIIITDASVEVGNTYATVTLTVNANTADFADRLYVFSQYTTGITNIAINAVNPVEVSEGVYTLTFNVVKTNVDSIDVYLTNGAINFAAETWNVEAIYSGINLYPVIY